MPIMPLWKLIARHQIVVESQFRIHSEEWFFEVVLVTTRQGERAMQTKKRSIFSDRIDLWQP